MTTGAVTVLVVDDEPDIRFLVRRVLSRHHGFEVVGEACDGADAVELAERLQPDIVLLDLMMHTPGDQALPHILAVAPSAMVVVFSGAGLTGRDRRRLLDVGAFAYYDKSLSDRLAGLLDADYQRFRRALAGEDVTPAWLSMA